MLAVDLPARPGTAFSARRIPHVMADIDSNVDDVFWLARAECREEPSVTDLQHQCGRGAARQMQQAT